MDELLELEMDGLEADEHKEPTIPEAFVQPLNLKQSKWNDPDDEWESDNGSECSEKSDLPDNEGLSTINGVKVTLTKTTIPYIEWTLYHDRQVGRFRCCYPSPLRNCWTPVETN